MKHGVADRGVGAYAGRGKVAELSVVHSCFNADQCEGPPTEASAAAPPPR
jgi:hypothetical protein